MSVMPWARLDWAKDKPTAPRPCGGYQEYERWTGNCIQGHEAEEDDSAECLDGRL